MSTAAPLDLKKFRKLIARARSTLHNGGADPERYNALRMAEAMARDAGLTFEAAVDLAEGREGQGTPQPKSEPEPEPQTSQKADGWFSDFKREVFEERERASRHPFPEHPMERALSEALIGYDLTGLGLLSERVPDAAMALIRTAIPWPRTLRAAVDEVTTWDSLDKERNKVAKGYRLGDAEMLRRSMLCEHILQANSVSVGDSVARARWLLNRGQNECISEWEERDGQRTVLGDLERMADRIRTLTRENADLRAGAWATPDRPIRRTNAGKRVAVEAVLREPGADSPSLREIAE